MSVIKASSNLLFQSIYALSIQITHPRSLVCKIINKLFKITIYRLLAQYVLLESLVKDLSILLYGYLGVQMTLKSQVLNDIRRIKQSNEGCQLIH